MKDPLNNFLQNGFQVFAETMENLNQKRNKFTEDLEKSLGIALEKIKGVVNPEEESEKVDNLSHSFGDALKDHLESLYKTTSPVKEALLEIKKSLDSGENPEDLKEKLEELKKILGKD